MPMDPSSFIHSTHIAYSYSDDSESSLYMKDI